MAYEPPGGTMMADILKAVTYADENPDVLAIVMTGEGDYYCAGMDLLSIPKEGAVLPDANVDTLSYATARVRARCKADHSAARYTKP
jgi:enoyl-CoA hydratase/carnithine racemase